MTFELRLLIIVLAAFAWSSVGGASLVVALWRRGQSNRPADRADALIRLRLLPLASGVAVAVLAAVAFLRFEPRGLDEPLGVVLPSLAAGGVALLAGSVMRLARSLWLTRRTLQRWTRDGEPVALAGVSVPALAIASDFPIVAVIGWIRPTLIIARSVLEACAADELRAILLHEQAHIDRRDNLRRLAFQSTPDILAWVPLSRRLHAAWCEAAEDAADDRADRLGRSGRALLAQALIRVARLVPPGARVTLPASALYQGEDLGRRIRRLLGPPVPPPPAGTPWRIRSAGALLFTMSALALEGIHGFVEAAVAVLP